MGQSGRKPDGRRAGAVRSCLRFFGIGFLVASVVTGIGYLPTIRWAGASGLGAMLLGCGVSFVAGCVGAIPIARALGGDRSQMASAVLVSTGARFLSVLVLVVPVTFSGWVDRTVFVVWVGISYLLMLLVDSWIALRALSKAARNGV
jgi:hypothetical protein